MAITHLTMSGRRIVTFVVALALLAVAATGPAALARPSDVLDPPSYDWPVPGPPVRAFDAPVNAFGPGHRGVDLPATDGQPVHPMADGVVVYAGVVAGDTWVSVNHSDGVMTSYGPLRSLLPVSFGQAVTTTDLLGRARGDAHGLDGHLHVGARREGRYIDPAELVAASPPKIATLVGPGQVGADAPTAPEGRPVLVPGTPPSPNHLVVLPGLTSHTGAAPFDLAELGYGEGTWQQFSYLGVDEDGNPIPYDHEATWGSVHDMALALEEQLRAHAAENPGQAVDLMGHSLGGLVAMYYLLVLHDATDPGLPPVGRIVTVASPLQGADSADAVTTARKSELGSLVLDLVEAQERMAAPDGDGPVAHADMSVLDDLRTDSPVAAAVAEAWKRYREDPWSSPLATGTDVLTIGSTFDGVVNERRSGLPGAEHVRVTDLDLYAHSNVTHDERTEELLATFLGGEPLPAGGWTEALTGVAANFASEAIAEVEYTAAELLALLGGQLP